MRMRKLQDFHSWENYSFKSWSDYIYIYITKQIAHIVLMRGCSSEYSAT